ncbi:MAG: hypothetical protein RI883_1253 [Bacteroidota bacterium]|jgi:predicted AlkP superfamily phosphohydrolase/phosphomutase/tetratricopeptide (TPR) repeat protein
MAKSAVKKVLVIGWDAADWKTIEPLMAEGKMPALKKLMEGGVYGRLQTLDPPLSPMLWTSIATGVRADKHGIGGFIEPIPDGTGLRPVTTTSRKVKAIWNILNQEKKKCNVVTWWPSNPAEPINGVMVSNLFQQANKPLGEEWLMPTGTIHPPEMIDELKDFRVHPSEITLTMMVPFIPNLEKDKELRKDKRTTAVMKVLSHAATVHAVSTHLMENTEWDFMAVYHDAIDHFSHLAMKYHPPHRKHIPQDDYENFKGVVEAGYRFHDMMLERTMSLIDEDTTVILISDHGFHSDHKRPLSIPNEPSGPAAEHSPYGILVMNGPGIKKGGQHVSGSSIIDITPTLLALYGLPVGKDMEGKVLYQCFENPEQAEFIESWEKVPGDSGQHDKDMIEDPWAAQEALKQLVELGYIEALEDDKLVQVEKAKTESEYYVARNMINGGRIKPAIEILDRIFNETKIIRYGQRLANGYLTSKKYIKCGEVISQLRLLEKELLVEKKKEREAKKLEKETGEKIKGKKVASDPFANSEMEEPLYLDYLEGLLLLALNKPMKAQPLLEKVQRKNKNNLDVALNIAKIFNIRKKYAEAEKQFIKALAIDDRSSAAHFGLGLSYLRRNMLEEALEEFLLALDENFYKPNSHYHLGETLMRMKDYENAANAFEVVIRLSPGMTKAHKWLYEIHTKYIIDPIKAAAENEFIKKNIKGSVYIITGLQDAGTPLVMKMLEDGGMPILFDEEETVTKNEKLAAYGYKKVANLSKDSEWIELANDKALKVYVEHLNYLPAHFNYKVIFVTRDIEDIIQYQDSQKTTGKSATALSMKKVAALQNRIFKAEEWIASQPNIEFLTISYNELIEHPIESVEIMCEFIGKELNNAAMIKSIKKNKVKTE